MTEAKTKLIRILQNAHAGELGAAYAYRGHWKSLRKLAERLRVQQIEREEWKHREKVSRWLSEFNAKPRKLREMIFWIIGRSLGAMCYVSGWFLPMYFAGRLESHGVQEYIDAAELAKELKMQTCSDEMKEMSRVEQEHENFFRQTVSSHRLLPAAKIFFRWS